MIMIDSGAHGSVVMDVSTVTEKSLVQTPLWPLDLCVVHEDKTLYLQCLSPPSFNSVLAYAGG